MFLLFLLSIITTSNCIAETIENETFHNDDVRTTKSDVTTNHNNDVTIMKELLSLVPENVAMTKSEADKKFHELSREFSNVMDKHEELYKCRTKSRENKLKKQFQMVSKKYIKHYLEQCEPVKGRHSFASISNLSSFFLGEMPKVYILISENAAA